MKQLLNALWNLLTNSSKASTQPTSNLSITEELKNNLPVKIDWTDPNCKVSKYFTVKEAIFLPSWNRLANEQDGLNEQIKNNLVNFLKSMDQIREELGQPMIVHVTYRPDKYNREIGGAKLSAHTRGLAMDWSISGKNCDELRKEILDKGLLEKYRLRMEHLDGSNWVHIDAAPVALSGKRYFIP